MEFIPVMVAGLLNYGIGYGIGYWSGNNNNSDANERVVEIQEINAQLEDQLSESREISGLIVDDKGSSFEFTSRLPGVEIETCQGRYVVENDIARATGSIACTTIQQITE